MSAQRLIGEYIGDNDKDIENFNDMLMDNSAVVSGSVALRLLLGEGNYDNKDYDNSDLDIYVGSEVQHQGVVAHFIKEGSSWSVSSVRDGDYPMITKHFMYTTTLLNSVTNKKVQVCMVVHKLADDEEVELSPQEAICLFDFTFLMNCYDGENVFSAFPADIRTKKGKVFNIQTLDPKRIIKYAERGFQILIDNFSLKNKSIDDVEFELQRIHSR